MVFLILTVLISTVWSILIYRIYTSNLNLIIKIVIIAFCFTIAVYLMPISFIFILIFFKVLHDRKIILPRYNTFLLVILVIVLNLDTIRMHLEKKYYCEYKKDYTVEIIYDDYTPKDIGNFYLDYNRLVKTDKTHTAKKFHSINVYKLKDGESFGYTIDGNPTGKLIAKIYDYFIPYDSFNTTLNKLGSGGDGEYCIKMGYLKNSGYLWELTQIFENHIKYRKDKK